MAFAGRVRRRALLAGLALTLVSASAASVAAPANAEADAARPVLAAKPYMGWSSWSLQSTNYPGVNPNGPASWLTEKAVLAQADVMAAKLKQHGYDHVNVDAGWLGGFDTYGRPVAKADTFPQGLAHTADYVHRKGLKFGTYLAVGLDPKAYDEGKTPIYGAAGCTTKDLVYPDLRLTNGWDSNYKIDYAGPCGQAYANSIANLLASWGVDFLKMDGVGPGSGKGGENYDNTADIAAWSKALKQTRRPIEFVLSWSLSHNQADFWKANSNGWRVDTDVECYCDTLVTWNNSVKQRWNDVVQWIPDAGPGHWNNLDSVDVGSGAMDGLTEAERQSYMTLWAIESAPLYIGDDLTKLDAYGLSLLTNDEVIGVNQAGIPAKPVSQASDQQVWSARNADGSYTVALFNLGSAPATVTADWADIGVSGRADVRDLWSHRELGSASGRFAAQLPSHGSKLIRVTPKNHDGSPSMVTGLRGTGVTASSVSLAWDPAAGRYAGYEVYSGGRKVAFARDTSVTVAGLFAARNYEFSVVAVDQWGRKSAASRTIPVTTPGSGGQVSYEAEDGVFTGGSKVADCSGCSGGKKAGNLGVAATVTVNGVQAAKAGTHLMTVSYVDGDSGRTAVVTVNGKPFNLPLAGTNNNDWGSVQTVTVPVELTAGANTIAFGNPGDYVADIDKITL